MDSPAAFEQMKTHLQVSHLGQLREFSGTVKLKDGFEKAPVSASLKDDIMGWIDEQQKKGRLDKARVNRVTTPNGRDTPEWNNTMFSVLEAAAIYLRRDEDMQKAIKAARNNEDMVALGHLKASQVDIEEVAKKLGMTFTQVCDMSSTPGENAYSGAYCGIFVSEKDKFIGVVFKGTTTPEEWDEDLWIETLDAQAPTLYGTRVHSGFYYGLFDKFGQEGIELQPFALIMTALKYYSKEYYIHVTGHSLGAAYATFLHCELNRLANELPATLKDVVTFGSPRTGLAEFVNKCGEKMTIDQKSWRIANFLDPVTLVPPRFLLNYAHIDTGYWLYSSSDPERISSERTDNVTENDKIKSSNDDLTTHGIATYYEYIDRITLK